MNAAKWIVAVGLVASGPIGAAEQVYDYQGDVMKGLGGPETLTAQLEFLGPVNNPGTVVNISVSFSGVYSGLFATDNCVIIDCATPGVPFDLQVKQSHGQFISAYLSFAHFFKIAGAFDEGAMVIGKTGDSFELNTLFGPTFVSVANSTPGVWTEAQVNKAPELDANGALCAMTLLAGGLLISMGQGRLG